MRAQDAHLPYRPNLPRTTVNSDRIGFPVPPPRGRFHPRDVGVYCVPQSPIALARAVGLVLRPQIRDAFAGIAAPTIVFPVSCNPELSRTQCRSPLASAAERRQRISSPVDTGSSPGPTRLSA